MVADMTPVRQPVLASFWKWKVWTRGSFVEWVDALSEACLTEGVKLPKSYPSRLDHVAIKVSDIELYVDFFAQVFKMEVSSIDGDPKRPLQLWIQGVIQLISDPDFQGPEGRSAHIAVAVDNIDLVLAEAIKFGAVSQAKGPNWIEMPDGLVFELLEKGPTGD